jgi:cyclophilin family peptidyl-prolyl cis-trans isomerase
VIGRFLLTFILLAGAAAIPGCALGDPFVDGPPRLRLTTSFGDILIELDPDLAPNTVANVRQYAEDGFYDGTIFHRVVPAFVIQGGGFEPGLVPKETRPPIANESLNGLKNVRGAVAMARADDPDSATSSFFINLVDNPTLDGTLTSAGYAVFGRVIEGMDVVDQIAQVPTEIREGIDGVPVTDVLVERAVIEPGPEVLSPTWQAYSDNVEYQGAVLLRDTAVNVLGYFLSRQLTSN